MSTQSDLQAQWTNLYKHTLPSLAKNKDAAQPKWPVHLDHCFARIILDNAIGQTKPWTAVVKSPAVKNMTTEQLYSAIEMGQKIFSGEVDLVELDERSLVLRGKKSKIRGTKRKVDVGPGEDVEEVEVDEEEEEKGGSKESARSRERISKYFLPSPPKRAKPTTSTPQPSKNQPKPLKQEEEKKKEAEKQSPTPVPPPTPQNQIATFTSPPNTNPLQLISTSSLTPFRKTVLSLLCSVPPGSWTTYAAIATHITATSHKTCARAVGNALRNNPFAPLVPCHRVLAAGGAIGGFGGAWGEEGEHAREKRELLGKEGVRFDVKGRAVGTAWCKWE